MFRNFVSYRFVAIYGLDKLSVRKPRGWKLDNFYLFCLLKSIVFSSKLYKEYMFIAGNLNYKQICFKLQLPPFSTHRDSEWKGYSYMYNI